jgi:hypothetical protein
VAIKKCFNIFQSLSDAKKIAREVRNTHASTRINGSREAPRVWNSFTCLYPYTYLSAPETRFSA